MKQIVVGTYNDTENQKKIKFCDKS
jgi:hypothetical protein